MYLPITNRKNHSAFTIIELLIVIGIISILLSLLSIVASNVYDSSRSVSEASSLRSMLRAYTSYATEHNGKFMSGYSNNKDEPVVDPNGNNVPWPASGRYVWRLYPYVDHAMKVMYTNDQAQLFEQASGDECWIYIASLYPSFALNSEWMGGDYRTTASPILEQFNLYGRSLSDVSHPSKQIVFASAKAPEGTSCGDPTCLASDYSMVMEGYYEMKSPYFPSSGSTWRWHEIDGLPSHVPTNNSGDHGNISVRHAGKVLVGQLDGSTNFLTLKELADMRRWAPKADSKDWTPSITP